MQNQKLKGSYSDSVFFIIKAVNQNKFNFAGDNQYQVINKRLPQPVRVQVINNSNHPVANMAVQFRFIIVPEGAANQYIETPEVITDSLGLAQTYIYLGSVAGEYEISANIVEKSNFNSTIFRAYGRKSGWFLFIVFGLAGGLALFLFGMLMMSNSLQKSAGQKMRTILSKLTYNRYIAILVGAFVTMVIQSSSATLVMLVSFVNSRLIKFRQSIGIFLGAAIGSTITAQIIAFKISDYALLFIGMGFFLQILTKKAGVKNIGESILGFGILFFGMHIMSETMYPLRTTEPFVNILLKLQDPWLGIIIGALLTALIQSSAAFIGIMIVIASQGLLSLEASIPLIIGANLGTAITAILASIESNRESKQVAIAFTLFKASGALVIIWWIPSFVKLVENFTFLFGSNYDTLKDSSTIIPRQIANAHTIYNIILAGLYLPLINYFDRFINFILPLNAEEEKVLKTRFLDESMIKSPMLALDLARQEILRVMEIVRKMTELILDPFMERNLKVIQDIELYESQVNFLRDNINEYLLKITRQQIESASAEEAFQMMYAVKEFEQIGDIVARNLKEKAISWCNNSYNFSEAGKKELKEYHQLTLEQINKAIGLYKKLNPQEAKEMKESYKEYRSYSFEFEKQHFERLKSQVEESLLSSKTHLELMTMFKAVGYHATNTARILLKKNGKNLKNDTGKSSN